MLLAICSLMTIAQESLIYRAETMSVGVRNTDKGPFTYSKEMRPSEMTLVTFTPEYIFVNSARYQIVFTEQTATTFSWITITEADKGVQMIFDASKKYTTFTIHDKTVSVRYRLSRVKYEE